MASAVISIIGGLVGAGSAWGQSEWERKMSEWESDQAEQDAETIANYSEQEVQQTEILADENKKRAFAAGLEEEKDFMRAAEISKGENILKVATSGIIIEGSPLLLMNEQANMVEDELFNIRLGTKTAIGDIETQKKLDVRKIRYDSMINQMNIKRGGYAALSQSNASQSNANWSAANYLLRGIGGAVS